jgi:hypothetical protein
MGRVDFPAKLLHAFIQICVVCHKSTPYSLLSVPFDTGWQPYRPALVPELTWINAIAFAVPEKVAA